VLRTGPWLPSGRASGATPGPPSGRASGATPGYLLAAPPALPTGYLLARLRRYMRSPLDLKKTAASPGGALDGLRLLQSVGPSGIDWI
jgi:hypothetical protein